MKKNVTRHERREFFMYKSSSSPFSGGIKQEEEKSAFEDS